MNYQKYLSCTQLSNFEIQTMREQTIIHHPSNILGKANYIPSKDIPQGVMGTRTAPMGSHKRLGGTTSKRVFFHLFSNLHRN